MLETLELIRPGNLQSWLFAIWMLVMISVPVIRWTLGEGAEKIGITAGVFAQVAAVLASLAVGNGAWILVAVVIVPLIGWASEFVGSRYGFPFGPYHYTEVLQPQVGRVPILIPLAWLMMMPPAWAVGRVLSPESDLVAWIIAAAGFTAWDLYLDPMMVGWDFWRWERKGPYLGIPLVNFLGWFGVSLLITVVMALLSRLGMPDLTNPSRPELLSLIFVITWGLMFVGQLLFWRLRVSAVVGLAGMGLIAIPALIRLL